MTKNNNSGGNLTETLDMFIKMIERIKEERKEE